MDGSNKLLKRTNEFSQIDFICGWAAACIETCALFPVVKVTFRQQLHGVGIKEAIGQLFSEGIPTLYRGLLPPLIQRTTTRMIMFGMYDTYKKAFGCSTITNNFSLCHAYSAFLAGTTEALLCPFERVQVLLQTSAYNDRFKNTGNTFHVLSQYGVKEFYRGFSLIVFRNGFSNTLFFTIRLPLKETVFQTFSKISENIAYVSFPKKDEILLETFAETNPKQHKFLSVIADFVSGAVLGASISTLFFPVNVVKHRMQSVIGIPFQSPFHVFRILFKERNHSIRELFRGVHLNYTRSLLTWGITNTMYELLKDFFFSFETS